jgi:hypothetical protein
MVTLAVLLVRVPTEQVTAASVLATLQVNVGLPVKLLMGVKVSVDVPLAPGAIVKVLGEALRLKSGVLVLKAKTLDQAAVAMLGGGSMACTCQ